MLVYVGTDVTVTVEGHVTKKVKCENCGKAYAYDLTRKTEATVRAFLNTRAAEKEALKQAEEDLWRRLYEEVDAVPCPTCGWYQAAMIPLVRAEYWAWCRTSGLLCLLLTLLLAVSICSPGELARSLCCPRGSRRDGALHSV